MLYVMYEMIILLSELGEKGVLGASALLLMAGSVYLLAAAFGFMGAVSLVGILALTVFIVMMNSMIDKTTEAGNAVTSAFLQINTFLGKESSITKLADALDKLGTALGSLKSKMAGGITGAVGGFMKGLFGIRTRAKSPIAQIVEDFKPLMEQADKFAIIAQAFEAMFKLGSVDLGAQFEAMATGLQTIYEMVNSKSKSGIQITHTLENLALIMSGTSAQSTSGISGIIKAIGRMSTQLSATITLDATATEKLLKEGTAQALCEIKDGMFA